MAQAARGDGIAEAQPFKRVARVALTDNLERGAGALTSHCTPLQPAFLVAVMMEDERVQAVFDNSKA